jgi:hypothetical protein
MELMRVVGDGIIMRGDIESDCEKKIVIGKGRRRKRTRRRKRSRSSNRRRRKSRLSV